MCVCVCVCVCVYVADLGSGRYISVYLYISVHIGTCRSFESRTPGADSGETRKEKGGKRNGGKRMKDKKNERCALGADYISEGKDKKI